MLSYTGSRNLYGKLTNNNSDTNLSLGDTLINAETRRLLRKCGNKLIERTSTDTSESSVQYYPKPARFKRMKTVTAVNGTTKWTVKESPTREHWDYLNVNTSYTSTVPQWWYGRANDIGYYPIPSGTATTFTYVFEIIQKDLSIPDYTTGTITTATNGTTMIIGSSTSWTSQMAGRYIQLTETNSANTGDGEWYEIASVQNGTTIILQRNYEGNSITGGTGTCTIGQMSLLPDGFHELPVYRASQIYYSKSDENRSTFFKSLADELESTLVAEAGNDSTDISVEDFDLSDTTNPNLIVSL